MHGIILEVSVQVQIKKEGQHQRKSPAEPKRQDHIWLLRLKDRQPGCTLLFSGSVCPEGERTTGNVILLPLGRSVSPGGEASVCSSLFPEPLIHNLLSNAEALPRTKAVTQGSPSPLVNANLLPYGKPGYSILLLINKFIIFSIYID